MRQPRILELCAGYGGLGMAVENLTGGVVRYVAEIDPAASAVLEVRYPGAPNLGDITTYDWSRLVGRVDIITAGFPCQDISNAGPRGGISGRRSGIYTHVVEAVRVLRPGLVFLENVAAIRSRGLWHLAADLAAIGYDLRWTCLRASAVGAAHHRDRWFAVARPVLDAEGVGPAGCDPAPQQSRDVLPAGPGGPAPVRPEDTPHADGGGREGRSRDEPEAVRWGESADCRHSPAQWWGDYLPAIRRWEDLTFTSAPEPTEIGPRGGRRLRAEFAEWLMGLPHRWVTAVPGLSRADQLRVIGNGVVPHQAHAAFAYLLGLDRSWTCSPTSLSR